MERDLFDKDADVRARLRRVVLCRLYTYGGGHPTAPRWNRLLRERFRRGAIPHYVVLTPDDVVVGEAGYHGGSLQPLRTALIGFLDRALEGDASAPGK